MKRRILLVDDDVAVLLTLKTVLEMNQFEVDTAASAVEAVSKLESGVYQMVITDVRMESETAGFEVIRAARKQHYDPATALLTAYPPGDGDWKKQGAQSLLSTKTRNKAERTFLFPLLKSGPVNKLPNRGREPSGLNFERAEGSAPGERLLAPLAILLKEIFLLETIRRLQPVAAVENIPDRRLVCLESV
ncbi:MAG: response regulator [Acidobacteria bacterium]|nr:MAG: response regulator [Acidobacteriota bacterium]